MDIETAIDIARQAGDASPRFDLMDPRELSICVELGKRAASMVEALRVERRRFDLSPPDPRQCACDFAVAHIDTPLRLDALLMVNDLDFFAEYWALCECIDRRLCSLKKPNRLRFAQSSAN